MKRLYFLLLSLLFSASAQADKVSVAEALKKAQALMPGERFETQKYAVSTDSKTAQEPFYIFNKVDGTGFVLVSADNRTTPILGYSDNGSINLDKLPDNVRYWLDSYARQIEAIDKGVSAAKTTMTPKTRSSLDNIAPMIQTTWNQDEPYSLMCPDVNGKDYDSEDYDATQRCVSGCVATAVAQVMYFYQSPASTTAIPTYKSRINKKSTPLQELPATDFEWEKMRLNYSNKETDEGAWAIAKLMRYAGQVCKSNYNTAENGGTSATIKNDRMIQYFGYSKRMRTLEHNYYTASQWEALVYDELQQGRPLPYAGYTRDESSGHQFVCDGYKDGLFHMNWGWGGMLDGYFVLSIADPDGVQGIGGGEGAFILNQEAVFCFMPADGDEEDIPQMRSVVDANYEAQVFTKESAADPFTGVTATATYKPVFDYEPTATNFDAEVGWGLYRGEELIACLGYQAQDIDITTLKDNPTYTNALTDAVISADLHDGKYQLRQVFRQAGAEVWTLMDNYGTNYLVVEISGNTLTVRRASKAVSFRVNSISLSDEPTEGETVTVTVNITNEGETNDENVCLWSAGEGSTEWTKVASMTGFAGPGETANVVLTYTPAEAGDYTLKVTAGDKETTALATTTIAVAEIIEVKKDGFTYACVPAYRKATILSSGTERDKPTLTIPTTVEAEGVNCQVKTIGTNAFREWKNITSLVIPEGIEDIGPHAFRYCTSLKKVSLPSTLKSIDIYGIYNCIALEKVVSKIEEPFEITLKTFRIYDNENKVTIPSPATLYVPAGTLEKYRAFEGWTQFYSLEELPILEQGDANGDGTVSTSDAATVLSFILGDNPFDFFDKVADMNGDGIITVTDAALMIDPESGGHR